jgi:F-type H+-transporting ATPase subunit alpha
MKQKQYAPMSVAEMALSIYAVNSGYMDKVELKRVVAFETALQAFAHTSYQSMLAAINSQPKLSKENEAALKKVIEDFAATGSY